MVYSACFVGVGNASSDLGNACCVIEKHQMPWLQIDCGHDSLKHFRRHYAEHLPEAIFITHLHFDHIGGLEQLYYQTLNSPQSTSVLYVPLALVARLTRILSNTGLAEGGVNLWDELRIVPVAEQFWHRGVLLRCYPVRHHAPESAYALHMPGQFFYSGDTKAIPEIMHHLVCQNELIFHDCTLEPNPSHADVGEILDAYSDDVLSRLRVYHYHDANEAQRIRQRGLQTVNAGERLVLVNAEDGVAPALKQA